jgi:hypothetical protein
VRYEGVGPGWDSTRVVVGGWPLWFVRDHPAISPVGSVSVSNGIVGVDVLSPRRFAVDVAIHSAVIAAVALSLLRLRLRRGPLVLGE